MRALGVTEDQIDALEDEAEPESNLFEVWPDHWQTVQVFLRVCSRWDVITSFSGVFYQSLIVSEIESVLRLMQIPDANKLEIFDNLRVMEAAVKEVLNERE